MKTSLKVRKALRRKQKKLKLIWSLVSLNIPTNRALSRLVKGSKSFGKHEQGLITSIEFVKHLLELAHDAAQAEREVVPVAEIDRGKAALT